MYTTTHWIAVFGLVGFMGLRRSSRRYRDHRERRDERDFSLSANPTAQTVKRGGTAV